VGPLGRLLRALSPCSLNRRVHTGDGERQAFDLPGNVSTTLSCSACGIFCLHNTAHADEVVIAALPLSVDGPTTDIIGALDTVNSLYEEPFFSCRQGGGSRPPAATGSPSPTRAVSKQHLHAVLSPIRRTGRRSSVVPLALRPSGNRFGQFPTNVARGVPGWLVVPRGPVCHLHVI
jgi:hypothetical protein